jgi:hypothetical protein
MSSAAQGPMQTRPRNSWARHELAVHCVRKTSMAYKDSRDPRLHKSEALWKYREETHDSRNAEAVGQTPTTRRGAGKGPR